MTKKQFRPLSRKGAIDVLQEKFGDGWELINDKSRNMFSIDMRKYYTALRLGHTEVFTGCQHPRVYNPDLVTISTELGKSRAAVFHYIFSAHIRIDKQSRAIYLELMKIANEINAETEDELRRRRKAAKSAASGN